MLDQVVRGGWFAAGGGDLRAEVRALPLSGAVASHLRVSLVAKNSVLWPDACAFISGHYHHSFGSHINVTYPQLLTLEHPQKGLLAAVGLRCAADEPLFLEQYLRLPVERKIKACTGQNIVRGQIVELGSFAAENNSAALYLIGAMAAYMVEQGYAFALVTATRRLRRLFSVFDFNLTALGKAEQAMLSDQSINWGRYYDDDPAVMLGATAQCLEAVKRCEALASRPARSKVLENVVAQARGLV